MDEWMWILDSDFVHAYLGLISPESSLWEFDRFVVVVNGNKRICYLDDYGVRFPPRFVDLVERR